MKISAKISVCIPTYNQAQYLKKAIDSALNQTVPPAEIIVSNDCSTDSTYELLEDLKASISSLSVIHQPQNLGIAKNTDACLRAASGDFVVRLDSDDLIGNQYCEKLSQLLVQYPDAGYAHANVHEIDQYDDRKEDRSLYRKEIFQDALTAAKAAIKGYKVAANIIMFRRKALEDVGYTTGRPNYVEDYHLSVDLASKGWGNVFCNEFLSYYRVWIDTGKVRQRRKMMEITGLYRVFNELLEPFFEKHQLRLRPLLKSKESIACVQAECLSWDVYNTAEKEELRASILKLSPSYKTRIVTSLYKNGNGKILVLFNKVDRRLRDSLKKYLRPPLSVTADGGVSK